MSKRSKRARRHLQWDAAKAPRTADAYQALPNSRYEPAAAGGGTSPRHPLGLLVFLVLVVIGCTFCGCQTLGKLRNPGQLEGSKLQWDPTNGVTGNLQLNGMQVDTLPPPPPLLDPGPLPEAYVAERESSYAALLEK